MRRYGFLPKDFIYDALNKLRAAFLAAKDGNEVEQLIMGLLTHDERVKIGRRIAIAKLLQEGITYNDIEKEVKVGRSTIAGVVEKINKYPMAFELVNKRVEKVEKEYRIKSMEKIGGAKMIHKSKVYTGFTRKDVGR